MNGISGKFFIEVPEFLRFYTASAITGRWRSGQDFPRWIVLGGRFTAVNLNPGLARPGHERPVAITFHLQVDGARLS